MSARRILFALVCAGLALTAATSSHSGSSPPPAARPSAPRRVYSPATAPAPSLRGDSLRQSASRFIRAFLRYEVGELRRSRLLGALATGAFAHRLLSHPPAAPGSPPPPARLTHLSLRRLTGRPPRALLNATARRGERPEQLAFLLEAQGGRWLVVGPAE